MRASSSARPDPRSADRPLAEVARLVDSTHADEPGHLAFHASVEGDDLVLGVRPLPSGVHPFIELAGTVAPASWAMFGLRVEGTSHHLDDGRRERTTTTFVVDREGDELSLLDLGDHRREVMGGAEGVLPDLCRRVLGLPTPPPPASTELCFTLAWLDRLLEAWNDPHRRRALTSSFDSVAALHPATAEGAVAPADPRRLVEVARQHAVDWPWSRLRREPDALTPPGGSLPGPVAAWMDDGFFARWTLGAYPDPKTLALDVIPLLGPTVGAEVGSVLIAMLDRA